MRGRETGRSLMRALVALVGALLVWGAPAGAAAQDTLHLAELRDAAARYDPRAAQGALRERTTDLELRDLSAGYLPQLSVTGQATYQSDVPAAPFAAPGGAGIQVPKDQYRADLRVSQLVWDGGRIAARRGLERARLAESEASVRADLYRTRQDVDGVFFRALLLQQRIGEVDRLVADLGRKLDEVRSQVRNGAALAGDTAAMQAEILQASQRRDELASYRRAALGVLARLTGRKVGPEDVLALPDLAARVRARRSSEATARRRPEFERLASEREVLKRQESLTGAERLPKLVAFGTAGYGKPGLNLLGDRFDTYWRAGIQFEWAPWHWGTVSREKEALDLRRQIVATEEEALSRRLDRAVQEPLETMDRLQASLASDQRIIELRSQLERQAALQLEEQVITPARYIDIRDDLYDARDAWQTHRVQLADARARYLTTLGYEPTEVARRNP
ncbi:MAG: TolC family protein [Candidatus Palauibacterales bacterium]|nr:TolC family protein [Candidatus Palauibacterales bacterium]MDP2584340.1 TolC family protein [Candidatus Palauibacterales bacterium]